nr:MAG TPA: hypothetical protein [Crassvirales sp.]
MHLWTIENTIITLFLLISEYSKIVDQKFYLNFFICYVIIISIFYFILNISFNTYIIIHI